MKLFSVDSPIFQFMVRLLDVLKINILWIICSIPIVTIGPATVAAFTVTMKMIDDEEGYVARQFLKAFRKNLKNGIPLGLLFLFALYVLYLDAQLVATGENAFLFLAAFLVAIFIFTLCFLYAFALSAWYENTLIKTLKNSFDISVRYFLRTLGLIAVLILETVIFLFGPTMWFFAILIGPTCLFLTISAFAVPFFKELQKEPGAVVKKEEDNAGEEALFKNHDVQEKGISKRAHRRAGE